MEAETPVREVVVNLSAVAVLDQALVKDVCAVLRSIAPSDFEDLSVSSSGKMYSVVGSFPKGHAVELAKTDLDTLCDVNPLRVVSSSVLYDGERARIRVKVCSTDHPITVTDAHIVKVVKKRRWGLWA